MKEWDYEKNKELGYYPEKDILWMPYKKVYWHCNKCNNIWQAAPHDRYRKRRERKWMP